MNISLLVKFNQELNQYEFGGISVKAEYIQLIVEKFIKVLVIIILMYLCIKIGNKLIEKFVDQQVSSKGKFSLDFQKALTIGTVLKSILKYSVYIIGVALMIGQFFGGMSLAAASVGGVALGFGAQSLVKDLINGIFILFEDQYGVGDHVTIGLFSGIIESIGIRTTVIRDFTGDLHLLPNGSIVQVTNHSRGNIRFMVDVEISYEDDVDKTLELLEGVCNEFKEEQEEIVEPIEVLGINSLNPSGVTIRIVGKSKPLSQWKMERELRKKIKLALNEAGVEIPYPKTQIINK